MVEEIEKKVKKKKDPFHVKNVLEVENPLIVKEEEEDEDKSKKEKEENPLSKKEDEEEKKKPKNLEEQLEKETPEPEVKKEPGKYYGTRTDATENSSVTNYGVAVSYSSREPFSYSPATGSMYSASQTAYGVSQDSLYSTGNEDNTNPYESRRKEESSLVDTDNAYLRKDGTKTANSNRFYTLRQKENARKKESKNVFGR